jgi:hypothetical protein
MTDQKPVFVTGTSVFDPKLQNLLDELNRKRGSHEEWFRREQSLSRWIAQFDALFGSTKRIWCKGEYQGVDHHYPAILVYDAVKKETQVYAPVGDSDQIVLLEPHYFHNRIPYAAIANEVYGNNQHHSTI